MIIPTLPLAGKASCASSFPPEDSNANATLGGVTPKGHRNLHNSNFELSSMKELISKLEDVSALRFASCTFTPEAFKRLAANLSHTKVTLLHIEDGCLDEEACESLQMHLPNNQILKTLHLVGLQISPKGFAAIANGVCRNNGLDVLVAEACNLNEHHIDGVLSLIRFSHLQQLNLQNNSLGSQASPPNFRSSRTSSPATSPRKVPQARSSPAIVSSSPSGKSESRSNFHRLSSSNAKLNAIPESQGPPVVDRESSSKPRDPSRTPPLSCSNRSPSIPLLQVAAKTKPTTTSAGPSPRFAGETLIERIALALLSSPLSMLNLAYNQLSLSDFRALTNGLDNKQKTFAKTLFEHLQDHPQSHQWEGKDLLLQISNVLSRLSSAAPSDEANLLLNAEIARVQKMSGWQTTRVNVNDSCLKELRDKEKRPGLTISSPRSVAINLFQIESTSAPDQSDGRLSRSCSQDKLSMRIRSSTK